MAPLRDFFAYRSSLSRIGFALVFAFVFLCAVSYFKGIQILMFVPALAAALFLRSWWEVRALARGLRISLRADDGDYRLAIRASGCADFFLRPAYRSPEGAFMFLRRKPGTLSWEFPEHPSGGEIVLYVKGSFDIFRHVARLSVPPMPGEGDDSSHAASSAGEYLHVREYAEGDDAGRIDPIRSSMRDVPYVRAVDRADASEASGRRRGSAALLFIESDALLRPRGVGDGFVRWWLIALSFAVIALQWESPLLSGALAATILITLAIKRLSGPTPPKRGRLAKNAVMIGLFALMVGTAFAMRDMTGAGSVFLVQILAVKRLFPDENEDGFLFLFLTLFVFVAVSLFSLAFWFILFFLVYLLLAVLSLRSVAGYVDPDAFSASVGTPVALRRHAAVTWSLFVLMIAFFFVLPHGNTAGSGSSALAGGTETVSGFAGEIDLNAVSRIKSDTAKKIVVEDLGSGDQSRLSRAYWRGERFTAFSGGRWRREWWGQREPAEPAAPEGENTYSIVYYVFGSDRLFLPAAAEGVSVRESSRPLSVFVPERDGALYGLSSPMDSPLRALATFSLGRSGEFADAPLSFEAFEIESDPDTDALFEKFWSGIDSDTAKSPSLLTAYVRDEAGFSYSIEAPARDLRSFLYEEKRGHCEYFATVLALTLQHFGYPATLVNGFYGGEANELGNAWIIRGSDAHSWVEIYDAEKWWRRYDATPTIAIEEEISLFDVSRAAAVSVYDYLDLQWYSHVAGYTGEAQYALLSRALAYRDRAAAAVAAILLAGLFFFIGKSAWRRWRESDEDRLVRRLSAEGGAFALESLSEAHPELAAETRRVVYGVPIPSDRTARELASMWRAALRPR